MKNAKNTSPPAAALSDLELEAMDKSAELAGLMRKIIGDGPHAYNDWLEATIHLHSIQNMILSQAAARAYPDKLRLLGEKLGHNDTSKADT